MKKTANGEYILTTAGHRKDLLFHPIPVVCGKITNGVSLRFDDECGFVLAYADLVEMIKAADIARADIAYNKG